MRDELARSRKLSLANLEKPYYVEYTLDDIRVFNVSASLGALNSRTENRARVPRVRVRVGEYSFDNTNYVFSDFFGGSRYDADHFTIDNNYESLRRGWWLATDRAFKGALEAIARKRAAIKNVTQPEALADLWTAEPLERTEPLDKPVAALERWTDGVRAFSALFGAYPELISSSVSFGASSANYYMHNSEGTTLRRPEPLAHVQAQAAAFAEDGSLVRDSFYVAASDVAKLPDEAEIRKLITGVAENVRALAKAPAGEYYSGPVLFEGIAGPQIMAELLVPNLAGSRRPIAEPGRQMPYQPSEFEGRVESRVLPEFLTVVDDPAQQTWNGQTLAGYQQFDEEGVLSKPVTVIDKGRFRTFLLTRQPVRGFEASNGRARMPGPFGARAASATNVFIQSSESVKAAELKTRLVRMIADRNKRYGIIVRKMDFPSGASGEEVRRIMAATGQSGSTRIISGPLLVYRVYPDGREELVRGQRFRGLSVRSLRDIIAVSEELSAFHYLNNLAPMALQSAGGYVAPVSVIGPSLLFDELELERPREDVQQPPVVPPPPLRASK
jgi:predicted Zn-dependent protease